MIRTKKYETLLALGWLFELKLVWLRVAHYISDGLRSGFTQIVNKGHSKLVTSNQKLRLICKFYNLLLDKLFSNCNLFQ